jgi:hypothetical protein
MGITCTSAEIERLEREAREDIEILDVLVPTCRCSTADLMIEGHDNGRCAGPVEVARAGAARRALVNLRAMADQLAAARVGATGSGWRSSGRWRCRAAADAGVVVQQRIARDPQVGDRPSPRCRWAPPRSGRRPATCPARGGAGRRSRGIRPTLTRSAARRGRRRRVADRAGDDPGWRECAVARYSLFVRLTSISRLFQHVQQQSCGETAVSHGGEAMHCIANKAVLRGC